MIVTLRTAEKTEAAASVLLENSTTCKLRSDHIILTFWHITVVITKR